MEIKVSRLPSICPCLFIYLGLNWMFILYTTELCTTKTNFNSQKELIQTKVKNKISLCIQWHYSQENNLTMWAARSLFLMVQIEEFRAWEEVFWLAWMFWIFPYDTALILELCFADRAPQRCLYGWKGIIWIQID